jgi:activator of HSP90 ATPase
MFSMMRNGFLLLFFSTNIHATENDGTNGLPIYQEVTIACSPEQITTALTSAEDFSEFSGFPATLSAEEGDSFSLFGGQITGRHIELVSGKRVVQAWRVAGWPEGVYSIINFSLETSAASVGASVSESTAVKFTQSGFPEGTAEHLNEGWHTMYWGPLGAYCE